IVKGWIAKILCTKKQHKMLLRMVFKMKKRYCNCNWFQLMLLTLLLAFFSLLIIFRYMLLYDSHSLTMNSMNLRAHQHHKHDGHVHKHFLALPSLSNSNLEPSQSQEKLFEHKNQEDHYHSGQHQHFIQQLHQKHQEIFSKYASFRPQTLNQRNKENNYNLGLGNFSTNNHLKQKIKTHEGDNGVVNILLLFDSADKNTQLQSSFLLCVSSLLASSSKPIQFYIAGDSNSFKIAKRLLQKASSDSGFIYPLQKTSMENSVSLKIKTIHELLSGAKNTKFSDPLFYISIVLHEIMPKSVSKMILLDADLYITSDISKLYSLFDHFQPEQAVGMARDNQPVYRNLLWEFRKKNPRTRVGDPPPDGLTGFNSGVVLLDLDKLRNSSRYNSYFTVNVLLSIVNKYQFEGHLGDQDFFTLLSFEYEELFYILPCGWNRQLCTWWRRDDLIKIFDAYFKCIEPVHIWHGNC
ncbi:unnamed protein product, partial [Lymnaea stagnalis]